MKSERKSTAPDPWACRCYSVVQELKGPSSVLSLCALSGVSGLSTLSDKQHSPPRPLTLTTSRCSQCASSEGNPLRGANLKELPQKSVHPHQDLLSTPANSCRDQLFFLFYIEALSSNFRFSQHHLTVTRQ